MRWIVRYLLLLLLLKPTHSDAARAADTNWMTPRWACMTAHRIAYTNTVRLRPPARAPRLATDVNAIASSTSFVGVVGPPRPGAAAAGARWVSQPSSDRPGPARSGWWTGVVTTTTGGGGCCCGSAPPPAATASRWRDLRRDDENQ